MSVHFQEARLKMEAQERLAEKQKIQSYHDDADKKAHHTVETLPYILPPVGRCLLHPEWKIFHRRQ